MKIVMPCAAGKKEEAGYFMSGNRRVLFVANPALVQASPDVIYARPDDISPEGKTWRQLLSEYNSRAENPFNLAHAIDLYENDAYRGLAKKFGMENVFILSAGWGLVSADFRLPQYDITFKKLKGNDAHKTRGKKDAYQDYIHLAKQGEDLVAFVGVKDYLDFFVSMTRGRKSRRIVFYNSGTTPKVEGCEVRRYKTQQRTAWQYSCARELMSETGHL